MPSLVKIGPDFLKKKISKCCKFANTEKLGSSFYQIWILSYSDCIVKSLFECDRVVQSLIWMSTRHKSTWWTLTPCFWLFVFLNELEPTVSQYPCVWLDVLSVFLRWTSGRDEGVFDSITRQDVHHHVVSSAVTRIVHHLVKTQFKKYKGYNHFKRSTNSNNTCLNSCRIRLSI